MEAVSSSEYRKLLRHPEWQKMKTRVQIRADFKCEHPECNYPLDENNHLNVHHTYYEKGLKPWEYPIESLQCLCERHHQEEHETFSQSSEELEEVEPLNQEEECEDLEESREPWSLEDKRKLLDSDPTLREPCPSCHRVWDVSGPDNEDHYYCSECKKYFAEEYVGGGSYRTRTISKDGEEEQQAPKWLGLVPNNFGEEEKARRKRTKTEYL